MAPKRIVVLLLGCVARTGEFDLPEGATLRTAVRAAGGFGGQGFKPSGVVTIRSPKKNDRGERRFIAIYTNEFYVRRLLNIRSNPFDLGVQLRDGDVVMVQFHIP